MRLQLVIFLCLVYLFYLFVSIVGHKAHHEYKVSLNFPVIRRTMHKMGNIKRFIIK